MLLSSPLGKNGISAEGHISHSQVFRKIACLNEDRFTRGSLGKKAVSLKMNMCKVAIWMIYVEGCVCLHRYGLCVYENTCIFFKYSKLIQTSSGRSCITSVKQNSGICLVGRRKQL